MSPRYKPVGVQSFSEELDAALDHEVREELRLVESREKFETAKRERAVRLSDVDPYGPRSPHSWLLDNAATRVVGGDMRAEERLARFRSAHEKRGGVLLCFIYSLPIYLIIAAFAGGITVLPDTTEEWFVLGAIMAVAGVPTSRGSSARVRKTSDAEAGEAALAYDRNVDTAR